MRAVDQLFSVGLIIGGYGPSLKSLNDAYRQVDYPTVGFDSSGGLEISWQPEDRFNLAFGYLLWEQELRFVDVRTLDTLTILHQIEIATFEAQYAIVRFGAGHHLDVLGGLGAPLGTYKQELGKGGVSSREEFSGRGWSVHLGIGSRFSMSSHVSLGVEARYRFGKIPELERVSGGLGTTGVLTLRDASGRMNPVPYELNGPELLTAFRYHF